MSRESYIGALWAALLAGTVLILLLHGPMVFPKDWAVPITPWLNAGMTWAVEHFGFLFRAFSAAVDVPMKAVREVLHWLPWAVTVTLVTFAAYAVAGWRLAVFSCLATLYMVVIGYWEESMNSLALVAISVPLAVAIGFGLGALGFLSERAERILKPAMDLLQTVPAFAYLLPILLLFGFGPVVGLIASILYAFPPTVRNTMLGLAAVPSEVIEAGLMAGATPAQLFWRVRVPIAMRQILLGVNQTTMAAFSMVIVASIIGGTADIGWEVLSTMRKAQFGESLLAGIVIALMAMVMDRITAAAAAPGSDIDPDAARRRRWKMWGIALGLAVVVGALAQVFPVLSDYPKAWEVYPARYLNEAINYLIVHFAAVISAIKTLAFFFAMLPVKIGLTDTISPFTWGFDFTPGLRWAYGAAALAVVAGLALRRGIHAGIGAGFVAVLLYFGLTKLPWPMLIAMCTLLAWQLGGRRLALGTFAGLAFLLLAGVWPYAMTSVYLCGLAAILSFTIGAGLGVLAAQYDAVSAVLRPFNDTLQTMPLFVILIPFVMIFKIGEFTALLAIMAYAIVPAIRYTEHGLRNIPAHIIEAATAVGCTRGQLLWRVKLPLALPVMMLGLNQTIIFAIAMLVIAALVGTDGLGQQVYIGLGNGDFGVGIVAGVGMAIIAMIADRMTLAWSQKWQRQYGLVAS
ncbi:MAG: ABC transporter permease subunit [Rhodobacteraceae bacterium]|nr:ABC transporter permease subunit [Paracoccaceae bacterium]